MLKAIITGMGGSVHVAEQHLRKTIEETGYQVITMSEWEGTTYKWELDTWKQHMLECDVVICFQREEIQPCKSNIKVTQAMALGLPVIASNILSYREVIHHGENGYLCNTLKEWKHALECLRDPLERKRIGDAGKSSVANYSIENISQEWINVLSNSLFDKNKQESKGVTTMSECVDIIIPVYNNLEYLKLTINSILLQTNSQYRIILSDAGSNKETWDYYKTLKGFTVLGTQDKRINFSQAVNNGILNSQAKYFLILNSDVMVSWDMINNMVDKMNTKGRLACVGVLSNCDENFQFKAGDYDLHGTHPSMTIEQIDQEDMYKFMKESNEKHKGEYKKVDWFAFYCVMLARSAINEVGLLDAQFINGEEDRDYCTRLKKYGYDIGMAIDSFCFHFGAKSRKSSQDENKAIYDQQDIDNHKKYTDKWSKEKVVIYCGPAFEKWNGSKVKSGFGGSESMAHYLREELERLGYNAKIYCDLLAPEYGYRDYRDFYKDQEFAVVDHVISSRSCEIFKNAGMHIINKYVWIHDIWLSNDANYDTIQWQIKKFVCLSPWHKTFVSNHHKIPLDKIEITTNSVDPELYKEKE